MDANLKLLVVTVLALISPCLGHVGAALGAATAATNMVADAGRAAEVVASAGAPLPRTATMPLPATSFEAKNAAGNAAKATAAPAASPAAEEQLTPPSVPESEGWEAQWAWGSYYSKVACAADEHSAGSWASDINSGAGVPKAMLRSEDLLSRSVEEAPEDKKKVKQAERALRLYNHAKWLAERNYARAAEWRYREASRLAKQSRRNVLAAHSLGRLGYFLMHWRRLDEAREVLQESYRTSSKSNSLAPYLLGLLERQVAGSDLKRLEAAEEMIMKSGEQPSEELEAQRQKMIESINYWQKAESSIMNCQSTNDVAASVICIIGHLFFRVREETP
eukprot:TRINITY_DN35258_c0_g1_i1.p1 TRINITY_DN35258_c0_g1~~TRINITY_DN35258_c0_g1_i1.p1  ORF type:complete len:335 (-),score=87.17 TRINITY_DN35258_c0_g1_i1:230-1234(-)